MILLCLPLLPFFFLNFNLFVFTSHVPQGGIINLSMPDTEDLVWGNPSSYTPSDESSNQDQTSKKFLSSSVIGRISTIAVFIVPPVLGVVAMHPL